MRQSVVRTATYFLRRAQICWRDTELGIVSIDEAAPMSAITAVLLAAGLSRRFGAENKLLADIDGVPMVRRTAERICASRADRVIVVLGHEADRIEAALKDLSVESVINPSYRDGRVSSVRAGLAAVGDAATGIMMCLSDQPTLEAVDYDALIDAFHERPSQIVVPFVSGKRGNPVVLPAVFRNEILGGVDAGCRSFIDQHPEFVHSVNVANPAYRADFDTPEAFSQARLRPPIT